MILVRIVGPHFVVGLEADAFGNVLRAAPIIGYMARDRWDSYRVVDYCEHKGWSWEAI